MDVSRLKKKDLKVWLPMVEEVDVLCRHLSQSEFDAISRQAEEIFFDPKTHKKAKKRNEEKFRSLLAREVVIDWRGLTDAEQPFPCTPENIDYLMEECTEFRLLVMDAPLSLEKMLSAEKAEIEKNS